MADDPSLPASIDEIAPYITRALSRGAADPKSACHWPTLASVGSDGAPQARTLVLRSHDAAARTIDLHTDARAMKVPELRAEPRAALHIYDQKKRVQVRLGGEVEVHAEGEAWQAAWAKATQGRTSDFSHAPGPGSPILAHDAWRAEGADPAETFTLLRFTYTSADYLHLGRDAHRRARVDFTLEPAQSVWLVP